uniref:Uncharacterized protein n=1 Tax=Davidia involucrata TaxID=16924 RepID=A0A5B7BM52_DAVIN
MNWPSMTSKVIHLDGRLQEFRQPIKASHVLSENPNCFLCSSETMFVDSLPPHLPGHEELQLGQIYFMIPISKSQTPLSLQDLCELAIKASTALGNSEMGYTAAKTPEFLHINGVRHGCMIPTNFDLVMINKVDQ